ncbi:MAG: monovalent cation/H+ antiporter complex subunit F [Clostridiales bacterium]|nr:sodium:proton antiporter [Clostridiales bacterium]MCD7756813.1 monovalent cation/H+ antiporter complex subunit F [Clostridiales bacterium]
MNEGYRAFFLVCCVVLTVLLLLCLVRAIKGPRLADRIIATNMIGTITIAIIALLSVVLGESAVLDISLIYAVMSFVSVIVLSKIYMGRFVEWESERGALEEEKEEEEHGA